jgi:hypothetical protein
MLIMYIYHIRHSDFFPARPARQQHIRPLLGGQCELVRIWATNIYIYIYIYENVRGVRCERR